MPLSCEAIGVSFVYPENWSVEVLDGDVPPQQVVLTGPDTAFWQLSRHDPDADIEALFDEALAALRSEYKEIEAWPTNAELEGRNVHGFDVNFYCLDLTVTAWLRAFVTPTSTFLLVCQAEDSEMKQVGSVFQAMLVSLLRGLV
jgi:hypothetical protein